MEEDKVKKKISHLVLSTPGACFLCLQDTQKDQDGPAEEDLNGGIIDLRTICRYLNINQCSLLPTSLANDPDSCVEDVDPQRQPCSFSVNLCSKCLTITEKLKNMIIELEKVKLMVNYHLHSFHKVLEGNDHNKEENLEGSNFLGRMKTTKSNNSFDTKLVQQLRKETRDKSHKILRKAEAAKPKVILSKCQVPSSPSSLSETPSTSVKKLISHLISTNVITSNKVGGPKLHRCPFCSRVMICSKFALHLTTIHPDKLLESPAVQLGYNPNTCTNDNTNYFNQLCRKTLSSQVTKCRKDTGLVEGSSKLLCYLCDVKYSDPRDLKNHILVTHTDKLCEQLIKDSSDKMVNMVITKKVKKDTLKVKRVRRSIAEKTCSFCGKIFSKFNNLKRHQVSKHSVQLFSGCKPDWMEDEQFRRNCRRIVRWEVKQANPDKIYKCGYCKPDEGIKEYRSNFDLVVHQVFKHREEMEEKLRCEQDKVEGVEEDDDNDNYYYWGGDDEGGDHEMMEEDPSEFDMKPDVDIVLDELISKENDL